MKIALSLLRIDLDAGPVCRLAIHRHYESGHGNAGVDPRALAAAAFGTIAQNVTVLLQWAPFDFGIKGGMVIDPEVLFDAMEVAADPDGEVANLRYYGAMWMGALSKISAITSAVANTLPADPIPDDDHGQNRP